MTDNGQQEDTRIGLSYVFHRMNDKYRAQVVQRALTNLQMSKAVEDRLRRCLKDVPTDGFRPGKAPMRRYQQDVLLLVRVEDDLAVAVRRAWLESQEPLRALVAHHLTERSLLTGEPDYTANTIETFQPDNAWNEAIDQLMERHPEESSDDLMLMAYWLCGRIPMDAEEAAALAEEPLPTPPAFQRILDTLSALPPDAPEWEYAVEVFPDDLQQLMERQMAITARVVEVLDAIKGVGTRHRSLLEFFQWDPDSGLDPDRFLYADPSALQEALEVLDKLLDEYAKVRETAAVRSEELQRRARREELEQRIDDALAAVDALEAAPPPEEEAPPEDGDAEPPPLISGEELAALRSEIERMRAEVGRLIEDNRGLLSANEQMREQIRSLEDDVDENRRDAEMWRIMYRESQKTPTPDDDDPLPDIESVAQAQELAGQRLSERLEFRLIAKSDTSIPFDRPRQVYDALEWLASVYYGGKTGENGVADLDLSLRQECGWRYTPVQSDITMGIYPEYYDITLDRRKRKLEEHIGTGNGHPRGTIRIAFLWDAERKKVVVGYIGRHQRTRAT